MTTFGELAIGEKFYFDGVEYKKVAEFTGREELKAYRQFEPELEVIQFEPEDEVIRASMTFEDSMTQMADLTDEQYKEVIARIDTPTMKLLHAAMGLCGEAGEIMEVIKKYVLYGKPMNRPKLFEEGGDLSWYLRLLAKCLSDVSKGQCSFEQMIVDNIEKLKKRYPKGRFDTADAIARKDQNMEAT